MKNTNHNNKGWILAKLVLPLITSVTVCLLTSSTTSIEIEICDVPVKFEVRRESLLK